MLIDHGYGARDPLQARVRISECTPPQTLTSQTQGICKSGDKKLDKKLFMIVDVWQRKLNHKCGFINYCKKVEIFGEN